MNIYFVSQGFHKGYDTYDSMVVIAESEEDAKTIHPRGGVWKPTDGYGEYEPWSPIEHLEVELIGVANEKQKRGVICASFNAG